jgi:hypothetical protein
MGQTGSLGECLLEPVRGSTARTAFMATLTTGTIRTMVIGDRYRHAAPSNSTTSKATKPGMDKATQATLATVQVRSTLSPDTMAAVAVIRVVETVAAAIRAADITKAIRS